jgi:general nucleoside transport system ATP-binding protein
MDAASPPVVEMRNISKRFGSLTAIHDASLDIRRGEVHALVGENGAGKSTLMNVLYGMFPRSGGEVDFDGKPISFANPREAILAGVGMVHQHFKLAPTFTVAQNIILGSEPMRSIGRIDVKRAEAETKALSEAFGLELDPRAIVGSLPVGLRQRVEILKALYRKARVLILDEPTAVLTPQETRELFVNMRALAGQGHSIVFITHKLREVLAAADRISVMRRGRTVSAIKNEGVTAEEIARLMVGRPVLLRVAKQKARPSAAPLLRVDNLTAIGDRGEIAVSKVCMEVRGGEIVGLAGVQGNGQDELVECIAGLRMPRGGTITIAGRPLGQTPAANRNIGLAYIPADRSAVGLSQQSAIWENLTVGHLGEFRRGPFLAIGRARRRAEELIAMFDVRGAEPDKPARSLSGGNQQKVQIARELTRDAQVIVAEQPSQGVDIGAIEQIHRTLVAMRDAGKSVFVVSADLDEIFSLSDRILVMYRGRIVADVAADATTPEEVGRWMGGIDAETPGDRVSA